MTYIIISILMIIIGLIGIFKNKLPKYKDGPGFGFAAYMRYYFYFYVLAIMGVVFLILEIFGNN